jgi:hypothetical protein
MDASRVKDRAAAPAALGRGCRLGDVKTFDIELPIGYRVVINAPRWAATLRRIEMTERKTKPRFVIEAPDQTLMDELGRLSQESGLSMRHIGQFLLRKGLGLPFTVQDKAVEVVLRAWRAGVRAGFETGKAA